MGSSPRNSPSEQGEQAVPGEDSSPFHPSASLAGSRVAPMRFQIGSYHRDLHGETFHLQLVRDQK
jgi:hypothetical protein